MRGWRLSEKGKKQNDFLVPSPKKTHPGPDGQNASGWYGRLRHERPISPLSVMINSDQPWQQSFDVTVWHFLDEIDLSL